MRKSAFGALQKFILLVSTLYGLNAFGQYPGVPNQSGSVFSSNPALADGAIVHGSQPYDPPPMQDSSGNSSLIPSLDDEPDQETVSVAELQHPLSRKGRSLILKAQDDLRNGNVERCFQDLDKAMKIHSAVPYVYGVRGAAYVIAGRLADGISELQQAVQVLPLPANYSNLGYAHLLNGDRELGEQEIREALKLHNAPLEAHYLMGLILLDRKPQIMEACDQLYRAQTLMPTARAALAVCYQRGGEPASADRQIRDLLGPTHQSEFESWKRWVAALATKPHPSSVFGLPISPKSAE